MDCDRPEVVSECQSFGSNCRVSSQPRKISRGILVDSCPKFRPKRVEEEAVVPTEEHTIPPLIEEDGKRLQSVNDGNNGNQSQSPGQEMPLLGTRAFNRKAPTSEGHHTNGAMEGQPIFSANYTYLKPGVERNARPQSQHGRIISGSKDVNAEVTNKFSFSPEQPIMIEDETEKAEIRGSGTLRDSLWKILETTSSPNKHNPSDCSLRNEPKGSDSVRKSKEEVYFVPESIPLSDTIESDSDHPNHSLGSQSTLYLGKKTSSNKGKRNRKTEPFLNHKNKRKKKVYPSREGCSGSPTLKQKKGERLGPSSDTHKMLFNEQKNQVENQRVDSKRQSFLNTGEDNEGFFCLKNSEFVKPKKVGEEKSSPQWHIGNTSREGCSGSPTLKQKKGERQGPSSDTHKMLFNVQENQVENQRADSQRQSFLNTGEDDEGFFCLKNSKFVKPKKVGAEKGSPQWHIGNTSERPRNVHDHLKLRENVDCPKDFGHLSFKNTVAQKSDVESPTFKLQTAIESPATCSQPCETKRPSKGLSSRSPFKHVSSLGCGELDDHSRWELSGIKGIKSFSRLLAARQDDHLPDSQKNISHAGESLGTVNMFQKPVMVSSTKGIFELTSQCSDSEASEEDGDVPGRVLSESFSSGNLLTAKEASVLHQDKKKCHRGGFRVTGFSSDSTSGKGTYARPLGSADQEDELTRAVTLFSLALQRVRTKMKSIARTRSAKVLMSVADRIHLQLQNAESRIQEDVGKLASFSKSKKKRLETRCEELQGELNVMHQSYKEEVNRHLQDFKSTVEGLEAHQLELKATVEKQRAFHRKLLLQAQEAIEADLIDAQKRITAMQNRTREKMIELKNIVADCLKDS